MTPPVTLCCAEGVATLTLSRPAVHNAFDAVLIQALSQALAELEHDDAVSVLVLTGAGASFSAGADLNWMRGMASATEDENRADSEKLAALMHRLQFFPKPTIARVNGAAFGGGVGLIACCDIAIGADTAKFALSEVKLGLVPAVISPYVIAAIGLRQARRLFITGEIFDATYAQRIGLLHEVVSGGELERAVAGAIALLDAGGPVAQREAKQLALAMAGCTPASAHAHDLANASLIARLRVSAEGQEGLTAFLAKRAPAWNATKG
jgi:methylglutaconyl-CoA hydratase